MARIATIRNEEIQKVDPVTFEILRHRLWAVNDEQAMIAAQISGSPAVYEVYDFNAALLTPDGRSLFSGVYVIHHATPLEQAVQNVLVVFSEEGDINDGDMFFTNDPWAGALHQNDALLISPVFWEDEIVCWTGIVMHEMDVGGPVPGVGPLVPRRFLVRAHFIPQSSW